MNRDTLVTSYCKYLHQHFDRDSIDQKLFTAVGLGVNTIVYLFDLEDDEKDDSTNQIDRLASPKDKAMVYYLSHLFIKPNDDIFNISFEVNDNETLEDISNAGNVEIWGSRSSNSFTVFPILPSVMFKSSSNCYWQ